jgi:hypothetical protein
VTNRSGHRRSAALGNMRRDEPPAAGWLGEVDARAPAVPRDLDRVGSRPDYLDLGGQVSSPVELRVERMRREAVRMARADAANGVPSEDSEGPLESEVELKDRCNALLENWEFRERRKFCQEVAEREEGIGEKLGKIGLGIDRFERLVNELIRLKARFAIRRREVTQELLTEGRKRARGIPTGLYISALAFLGIVEFFANAPVFNALLPRDPLSERQVQLLTEVSSGWLAGIERVAAHILFRPDAALLAAGVITFLCVLAHFFGHALRDLVMQGERKELRHTVQSRSAKENVVPIVLSAVGLVLTLGVLYEARATLGVVGEERYVHDMEQVEEFRRQAGWLRVDGNIMEANEMTSRAEDVEAAATELREYSLAMARMNFPVLLLNLTLVLCAISAAYFHRRDARPEHFNEMPFEDERKALVESGERCAEETSNLLARVGKEIRDLKTQILGAMDSERRSVVHELESVLAAYRAENGRARGLDPRSIPAFRTPVRLAAARTPPEQEEVTLRTPEEYEWERIELAERFKELRRRFTEEATATW